MMVGMGIANKLRGCPPLASSETLFSSSMMNIDRGFKIMSWDQFSRLDPECKNSEIQRLLPLVSYLTEDINNVQRDVIAVENRLQEIKNNHENIYRRQDSFREKDTSYRDTLPNTARTEEMSIFSASINIMSDRSNPDPFVIAKSRTMNKRVKLNVGGIRHEIMWKILETVPTSRLGLLSKTKTHEEIMQLCDDYSLVDNEYFFDRHSRSFNTILNFYRTGKLHIADEMCILAFQKDLEYWMIDENWMDECCIEKYCGRRENVMEEMEITAAGLQTEAEEDFGTGKFSGHQKFLWDLMEHSDSSTAAQLVSVTSISFVAVSIVGMIVNTLEALQYTDMNGNLVENPILSLIETTSVAWFTMEYLLRFAGSPEKIVFMKDAMNVIDVLSIFPFFLDLFVLGGAVEDPLEFSSTDDPSMPTYMMTTMEAPVEVDEPDEGGLEDILQVFKIFKLARVLKLARHSPGLQAIAYTLKNSIKELGLLVFLITISGLIFASFTYFIELGSDGGSDSGLTSIPTGIYWVVVTMTTVGYGDIAPVSGLGKLFGSMCAVAGVLVLSLPIPIIAANFERFHKNHQAGEKAKKRKALLLSNKKKNEKNRIDYLDKAAHDHYRTCKLASVLSPRN